MTRSIYVIAPDEGFPTYYGTEVLEKHGQEKKALIGDLATVTLAALIPSDFSVEICDEHIDEVNLDTDAEIIAITGKSTQVKRMAELGRLYKERGKTVVMGGPAISLCPEPLRPYCDVLVRGEIEEIAEQIFGDLLTGNWKSEYEGSKIDLSKSPIPRWDLYPNDRALIGCVQTSRGCPFECEFCDVIQYVGRHQRHKEVDQVLAELDSLYALGYRNVFLADDNLTVYRRRSKELLRGLVEWNARQPERMYFSTQLSIDTARDDELLQLLGDAGPFEVFIGIETPNEESLRETGKRQNMGIDMVEHIHRFYEHGILVNGGMIVGFDADGLDVFDRQFRFGQATSVPVFTVNALMAPTATPLFERMERANRLINRDPVGFDSIPWTTNIVPKKMSVDQLIGGLHWLVSELYHPDAFGDRLVAFIEKVKIPQHVQEHWSRPKVKDSTSRTKLGSVTVISGLRRRGPGEARLVARAREALAENPAAWPYAFVLLFSYAQIRYMWEYADLGEPQRPEVLEAVSA